MDNFVPYFLVIQGSPCCRDIPALLTSSLKVFLVENFVKGIFQSDRTSILDADIATEDKKAKVSERQRRGVLWIGSEPRAPQFISVVIDYSLAIRIQLIHLLAYFSTIGNIWKDIEPHTP
jgi:hypothetical protein